MEAPASMLIKVEDVAPHGYAVDRATVRRRKTGHPVRFELTEEARQAIDDYIVAPPRSPEVRTKATLCAVRYLGIQVDDALAIAEQIDV